MGKMKVKYVNIDNITVGNRLRNINEESVDSLIESIEVVGLINPITIDKNKRLIAGNHRLEACKQLGWTKIPVTFKKYKDKKIKKLKIRLIEIDENLRNSPLTILERAEHLAERKKIYEKLYPESKAGYIRARGMNKKLGYDVDASSASTFTADVKSKIGYAQRTIQEDIQIATDLSHEVKDKIRGTELEDEKRELLTLSKEEEPIQNKIVDMINNDEVDSVKGALLKFKTNETLKEAKKTVKHNKPKVYNQNAIEWLQTLNNKSSHLLLTDPPYSTDVKDINSFVEEWVPLALSKVRSSGHAYICAGAYPEEISAYINVLKKQNRFVLSNILIWTYRNTLGPSSKMGYNLNYQVIFYLYGKKAKPLNCPIMNEQFAVQDITAPDGRHGNRFYKWQKPDELAERFIRHSTKSNDIIIDPFVGSGTFLVIGSKLGRKTYGSDNDKHALKICKKRGCRILVKNTTKT